MILPDDPKQAARLLCLMDWFKITLAQAEWEEEDPDKLFDFLWKVMEEDLSLMKLSYSAYEVTTKTKRRKKK